MKNKKIIIALIFTLIACLTAYIIISDKESKKTNEKVQVKNEITSKTTEDTTITEYYNSDTVSSTSQSTHKEVSSSKSETSEISKTEQATFSYTSALDFSVSESLSESKDEETEESTPAETENTVTEASTEATVVSETEASEEVIIDDSLESALNRYGFSCENLGNSQQLIFVESSGTSCTVSLYEKTDLWAKKVSYSGIVGKNGVNQKSREGDYCTPFGLYSLGFAFGMESFDGLNVEYRIINSNCYWVDDPESEYYNQWVETDTPVWNSAEHLSDYENSYHYGIVINYNMNPVVPGAGSAIFLHCATGDYTAGCVAVPEENMTDILRWVDSGKSPLIIIV
ncbi:MAG: L,D-transpeptidase family protein [Oscillospiraceae bacterium]|nr:L,D-transpeptidase family protein [Oscillospiraceae bacterium]